MSEREFTVEITESDFELLAMLLERHAKVCAKNARMARENGYGSSTSLSKADDWNAKAEQCFFLTQKLTENAN